MSPPLHRRSLFESTRRIGSLSDLGPRRLLAESVPLAAVVAFWTLLGAVAGSGIAGTAVRLAGIVMAGAYALVRGWQVVSGRTTEELPRTPRSLVRASVTPAIACIAWIAAAALFEMVLFGLWHSIDSLLPLERFQWLAVGIVDITEFVAPVTASLAVVLYAAGFVRTYTSPAGYTGESTVAAEGTSADE
jgi:hypothetical protein